MKVILFALSLLYAQNTVFDSVAPEAQPENQKGGKYPLVWTATDSIENPECAFYDLESNALFVSNVAGSPTGRDGKGWISKLGLDGKVIKAKWADGLDAPKGMRAFQGNLWVTDITKVHRFNLRSGKKIATVEIPEAQFLNDVAIDDQGGVYVSDTVGSKIYRIERGKHSLFAEGPELESPNGMLFSAGILYVGAWGLAQADLSAQVPGRLYTLDLKTKQQKYITPSPFGHLDGLEQVKDGYYVSDWVAGKVFWISKEGKSEVLLSGFKGSADIGYITHKHLLIVPRMNENRVTAFDVSSREK